MVNQILPDAENLPVPPPAEKNQRRKRACAAKSRPRKIRSLFPRFRPVS
ncbi:hypothetical protein HMPREF7215_1370 [Pyramidobacter piscolens W5455]|uniref:Uncharacterized protein n=1 Tax=Pyramidobacter piscolens W5455 TaxID=352165 RepID=A0ABP2HX90_9BACT|nr:hypothetical protein HMPREF7215_1370 [Pyramidobacter piscolens W5455]